MPIPPRPSTGAQIVDGAGAGVAQSKARDAGARILATATELFARYGYNGVSTRDVASAAKVNEVTVYRHYPRKRELYVAVLESELQQLRLRGDLLSGIAEATDGHMALECAFELIVKTLMQRPAILRLLQFSALELNDTVDPLIRRHLSELIEVVARYLEPWMRKGELRGSSGKAVILTLVGIVISHNPLQRLFHGNEMSPETMFEAYTGFAFLHPQGAAGANGNETNGGAAWR
jgi:AcrR family transcriptional regulator